MEGTDCKLSLLGKVADKTNGTLSIVNPLDLTKEFKSILSKRIVATSVDVTLIVNHKYLYIRDEELEIAESKAIESNDLSKKEGLNKLKKSVVNKLVGNANIDTELTFEYGIRKLDGETRNNSLKEIPFQLQIRYVTIEGAKCIRVISKMQEFTKSREKAEKDLVKQEILWCNAAQKMSCHFLSNDVVATKYKSRQLKNYAKSNMLNVPEEFQQQQCFMDKRLKTDRVTTLNDVDAKYIYNGKKISSSRMKN